MNQAELLQETLKRATTAGLQIQCPGAGNPHSEIAIVAEAPGDREIQMKMPQVGGGGRFLWDVLRKYDVNRQNVWTTNVVKRQLIGLDDEKVHVSKNELDHWHYLLRWELSQLLNVRYIVVLGSMALQFFTGDTAISKWRGSVLDWEGKKIVIGFNPAYPLREPKWEIVFRHDMAKLGKLINGTWKEHKIEALVDPSPTEVVKFIDRLQDERLPTAFDIETGSEATQCIGLANTAHLGMCINFRTAHDNHYSAYEERFIWRRLDRFMRDPNTKLVAQNASFDVSWLWWNDKLFIPRVWFDTMLAHHTLYPPLPHSLAFLVSQYTTIPYYKDEKNVWREGGDITGRWTYNVKDCCSTIAVQKREHEELRAQGLENFFFSHVMRLQPYLINMTMIGVKADVGLKDRIVGELQETLARKLSDLYAAIADATGDHEYRPNPKSPKQLAELFFRRLRLVGRGSSTDEENRKRMRDHPRTNERAIAVIDKLNAFVEDNKFTSTYAEMTLDPDNRFRCEWKQMGVAKAPGRLSSSQTNWGTGGNMQNIPVRAKSMFIADEGYRFVYFDLAQAEARVVAWLANITSWKEQFERARLEGGFDCHRALAADLFNVPYDNVPKEDWTEDGRPTIRYIAKRCRHGLNYRMGPDKLAITIQKDIKDSSFFTGRDAVEAYHKYHRVTPELRKWWDGTITEVRDTKELWSPLGRRWRLLERLDDDALESVVAFKPQSTIGDRVASVIYAAQSDPEWPDTSIILLDLHDALIGVARDSDELATRTLRVMKKYAEAPIIINGEPLIIPADCAWSVPDASGVHRWDALVGPDGRKLKGGIQKIKDPAILEQLRIV